MSSAKQWCCLSLALEDAIGGHIVPFCTIQGHADSGLGIGGVLAPAMVPRGPSGHSVRPHKGRFDQNRWFPVYLGTLPYGCVEDGGDNGGNLKYMTAR